ncbi:3-oxoacyl-[acyl-carrier protein] reductase [hydrothermal vent metagenome]|uniref:3-oxoacyl-[acyl-carrier protein] reductase n=1 Tax=hydrothermal vent metagenome TaxID=652676 RepID=A0A3B1BJQ1_9ZZZZ
MGAFAPVGKKKRPMSKQAPVALITGAARRLGKAITLALADDGFQTAIHYRGAEKEAVTLAGQIEASNGSAKTFRADLTDHTACARLVDEVTGEFGRLDVIVNNASIFAKTPLSEIGFSDIEKFHRIHVVAPAMLSLFSADALRDSRPGRIINILDIYARIPRKGYMPYSVSKAGLEALTKQLALELAPDILVNAVAPGAILEPKEGMDEAMTASMIEKIPLQRFGEPDDIAKCVLFLARSNYITGQTVVVDGGRSLNI